MKLQSATDLVVMPRTDGLMLYNRRNLKAVTFPLGVEPRLRQAVRVKTPLPPSWLKKAFDQLEVVPTPWHEMICLRTRSEFDYRRVTWELTEKCNFRCVHCYLGEKLHNGLPMESRLRILDKIAEAGCIWVQLTGGEALADPLFESTYREAWKRGLMVTVQTNGALLSRWIGLFQDLPPWRITFSLYGASPTSFAAMTGAAPSNYYEVMRGVKKAAISGIRLRATIIAAKPNAHETAAMENMMLDLGVEHHTYSRLVPTVQGGRRPLKQEADIGRLPVYFMPKSGCNGGVNSLHIHASGQAGPCKLLPNIAVDLLSENISDIKRLAFHPGTRSAKPECETCSAQEMCMTCGPVYALHKKAGRIPAHVCWRDAGLL
ncbi:MAG: radical SAM protein [Alphaproteobacteria bacterium]|nr:radical SAM protein [Alphaproteobacteria bacterium]